MASIINFNQAVENLNRKNKIAEIDILRSLCMLFVVSIHMLNIPVSVLQNGILSQKFFFVSRGMLVFAVPCFIFLSMTIVSMQGIKSLKDFYKKKFIRIVMPYLLWSVFYLLVLFVFGHLKIEKIGNLKAISYYLFYGKSYEHLYFMPILIGLTAISPLMIKLAKKFNNLASASVFALSLQMCIYLLNKFFIYQNYQMLSSTFFWYMGIAFLGIYFGLYYEKNTKIIIKYSSYIFMASVFVGVVHYTYQSVLWQSLWNDVKFNTTIYNLNLNIYFTLVSLSLLIISYYLANDVEVSTIRFVKYLKNISPYSYGIYFVHPIFTFFVGKFTKIESPITNNAAFLFFEVIIGVFVISLICKIITEKTQNLPILHLAYGNSRKSR